MIRKSSINNEPNKFTLVSLHQITEAQYADGKMTGTESVIDLEFWIGDVGPGFTVRMRSTTPESTKYVVGRVYELRLGVYE